MMNYIHYPVLFLQYFENVNQYSTILFIFLIASNIFEYHVHGGN